MGTASPINASDIRKDGQRTKYCEREPPLIQEGDKVLKPVQDRLGSALLKHSPMEFSLLVKILICHKGAYFLRFSTQLS